MNGLVNGRVVYFVFDSVSAEAAMRRRTNSQSILERLQAEPPTWPAGAQAHIGNPVSAGAIYPAIVVAVNGEENVNLKVLLDGCDEYWATSVGLDSGTTQPVTAEDPSPVPTYRPYSWHWMFEKQATRYTPGEKEIAEIVAAQNEQSIASLVQAKFDELEDRRDRADHGPDARAVRLDLATTLEEAENADARHGNGAAYLLLRSAVKRTLAAWPVGE